MKFHENLSSGSRVVQCGNTDGQTDMTRQIVAFRNFAMASQLHYSFKLHIDILHFTTKIDKLHNITLYVLKYEGVLISS